MKRIIASILCMILVFSSVNYIFAESETNSYEVEKSLGILNAIGRFTEYSIETVEQTAEVTRGEFAEVLAELLKLDVTEEELFYHDVSKEHYAYRGITAVTRAGYMNGCGNNLFEPDRVITKNEAAMVFVSVLGYKNEAIVKGGSEFAYINIATKIGLFDGTVSKNSLTFGDMLVMLTNALITPVMETKIVGKAAVYAENQNETLLSVYYDCRYVERERVTATNNTGIYGEKKVDDYVTIGGVSYIPHMTNMEEYLGSFVNFIYKDDKNAKVCEIVWIEKAEGFDEFILTDDVIRGFDSSDYTYKYYTKSGSLASIGISRNVSVIYNGSFETDTERVLKLPASEVRLVENKDGVIDVAIVSKYDNYVIDSVYNADEVFTVRDNTVKFSMDSEDYDKFIIVDGEGTEKTVDDLTSDTTVSIFTSLDGRYRKLVLSNETAEGVIQTVKNPLGTLPKMLLEGTEYDVSASVDASSLKAGDTVFVYLDYMGRIAYVKKNHTLVYMAYIVGVSGEGVFGISPKIKAFNQDGKMTIYETTPKFKVDGAIYSNLTEAQLAVLESAVSEKLAILDIDKEGRIRGIDTSQGDGELKVAVPYTSCNYRPVSSKLGKLSCIDSSTKIFAIPDTAKIGDDHEFRLMNKSQLGDWRVFNAQSYKYSEDSFYADAVIIKGFNWNSATDTTVAFVYEESYQTVNDNGDVITVMCGIEGSEEKEYPCENGYEPSGLTTGCGLFLSINGGGEVYGVEPVFSRASAGGESNTNLVASRRIVVGYVTNVKGNIISVGYTSPTVTDEIFDCSSTPILVVDETKEDKIKTGTVADIVSNAESSTEYSKIAIQTMQLSQKMIVVYN